MRRLSALQTFVALPLAVCGMLVGQAFLASSASAGITFVRTFNSAGNAALHSPTALTTDEFGNVYVADTSAHRIVKFDADGNPQLIFGNGGSDTAGTDGHIYYPSGITYQHPYVLVADTGGNDIQLFDTSGRFVTRWPSNGTLQFNSPDGIAVDCNGYSYVSNSRGPDGAGSILVLDGSGHLINQFGHANLAVPVGIAVETDPGAGGGCTDTGVYVADEYNGRIVQFKSDGTFVKYIGSRGTGPMQFQGPDQIALENFGGGKLALYVAESGNARVQQLVSGDFGQSWSEGQIINESSSGTPLNDSHGVAVDGQGHIFVAQTEGSQVFEYANAAPALKVVSSGNSRSLVKGRQSISLAAKYNQLGKKCVGTLKATITVPPNASHVFSLKGDMTIVDHYQELELGLSDRQMKWLRQAWHAGHKVPVKAKASGDCSGGVHVTDTDDFKI